MPANDTLIFDMQEAVADLLSKAAFFKAQQNEDSDEGNADQIRIIEDALDVAEAAIESLTP